MRIVWCFECVCVLVGGGCASSPGAAPCEATTESVFATVLVPSCTAAGCHVAARPAAGLDLATRAGLEARLVAIDSSTCADWKLVTAGDSSKSFLVDKLQTTPACGAHMPSEGAALTSAQVTCVRDWIAKLDAGAACETCGEGSCVDRTTNDRHCGACGNVCPMGSQCSSGACVCANGALLCGGACVDPKTDATHCGACSNVCPMSSSCTNGACVCAGGATICGGGCVDTATNPSHCGGCNIACGGGQPFCRAGSCSATCGNLTSCGNACVDTQTSFFQCGNCSTVCPTGATCSGGVCTCPAGTQACAGKCVNTSTDAQNCGGCGTTCGAGLSCSGGACACPSGQTLACGRCVSAGSASYSAAIQPVFTRDCASSGCHDGGGQAGPGNKQTLDLRAAGSYADLVGALTDECTDGRKRVSASQPSASYLWQKLQGTNMCKGSQMPKQGVSLSVADQDAVWKWICAGAPND